mgnify:CR=1 FL=1
MVGRETDSNFCIAAFTTFASREYKNSMISGDDGKTGIASILSISDSNPHTFPSSSLSGNR